MDTEGYNLVKNNYKVSHSVPGGKVNDIKSTYLVKYHICDIGFGSNLCLDI